jgi:lambda family phage portal protein
MAGAMIKKLWNWIKRLAAYDGASIDRPNGGWRPATGRAPEEIDKPERQLLIDRGRDLERNSDIIIGALEAILRNSIGNQGIIPQAHVLKAGGQEDEKKNDAIEELWKQWTRQEHCDIAGVSTFAELQALVLRRRIVDGEVFIRKIWLKGKNNLFPLRLQVMEPDQLDKTITEYSGRKVYDGIEVDEYLRPVGYWFRPDPMDQAGDSVRIDAQEVIHLWSRKRASQIHGVSELAPIMQRAKDSKEYLDAELMAARIAACFAIFIRRDNPGGMVGRADKGADGRPVQEIAPGMIAYLAQGETPVEARPDHPNGNSKEFLALQQRLVGAGTGQSYEVTSRDMSQVNYSSARQGHLEDRKTYGIFQQYMVDHFCRLIWEAFVESIVLAGLLKVSDFHGKRERYISARWIRPGWEWVDPLKEVRASSEAMQIGASTLEEICGAKGLDWQEVLRQRAREQKYAEELGVKLGELPPQELSADEKEE